jgi:hypothetical protein
MKNKFFKKFFLGLVLVMLLGTLLVGCGGTVVPPPPPPPPATTLTVYSQCGACWGFIWVNGASTGEYIDTNGAVTIQGLFAGTVASVQIVDEFSNFSHVEMKPLVSGSNFVIFTYF